MSYVPRDEQFRLAYKDLIAQARSSSEAEAQQVVADLGKRSLYFLLVEILNQRHMINPLWEDYQRLWLFDRCQEVQSNPDGNLDLWAREHYKLLSDDTPVITPAGYRRHGDLLPGDIVYSPCGRPIKVQAVTGRQIDPEMYWITFENGQKSYREVLHAGGDHLWDVEFYDRHRRGKGRVGWTRVTLSTKDLMNYTLVQKGVKNPRWYRIKCHSPLLGEYRTLPVPPYALGAWLGDGDCKAGRVTNRNAEVWERIKSEGLAVSEDHAKNRDDTQTRTIYGLSKGLRDLGLLGGKSSTKFIPKEYLGASKSQRIALLQGLMDTDGTVAQRGNLVFVSTSKALAEGMVELLRSLGIPSEIREHEGKYDGRSYNHFRVSFAHRKDVKPFSLKSHLGKLGEKEAAPQHWYITDISLAETAPAQCIQVEGGMYLAGKFNIPTRNSTIITFGLTIQDILNDPEITVGFFSHTRPISKGFLRQIKREFESNELLKSLYPDIFWADPQKQAPKWSEDDGIIVKRQGNPKESTIEAWGLVDGQPTSKHFKLRVYDDVVTRESVTTPDVIDKVTKAWELSTNLGAMGGRVRYIGTRYHFNDTYRTMLGRNTAEPRIHPATVDGKVEGDPVLLTREDLAEKRRTMGPYTFGCQMLLDPKADQVQGFKEEWLRYYHHDTGKKPIWNKYLLCDPAGEKKKDSDYTVMLVIALGEDNNHYVVDGLRSRLNLTERTDALMRLHRLHRPIATGYEKYGKDADIEHIQFVQGQQNYRFAITELGGPMPKNDRIRRLIPDYEQGRVYWPHRLLFIDHENKQRNLTQEFVDDEYKAFPVGLHDDILDCQSRIKDPDLKAVFPNPPPDPYANRQQEKEYDPLEYGT